MIANPLERDKETSEGGKETSGLQIRLNEKGGGFSVPRCRQHGGCQHRECPESISHII